MNKRISKIENNVQDRNSEAWKKLCDYVDKVASENSEEFAPLEALGSELFAQIHTLPESISKLKHVKKVWLYGSKLKRIPPEIGDMKALEYFDPYTSYDLHWFPYEIIYCRNLRESRVSTRALYGNYKNRMGFPRLTHNLVRYCGDLVKCSICRREISYEQTKQLWISLRVGTDVLPLLANLCSKDCESRLPQPQEGYVQYAHKGGADLKQPPDENELFEQEIKELEVTNTEETEPESMKREKQEENKATQLLKLIRKIWER
jgi:hypothetical protein